MIGSMDIVSVAEARERLDAMIDKVVCDRAPLAIVGENGIGAVLVSASEWASIEAVIAAPPSGVEFEGRSAIFV
jgi:antitoxin YefM